MRRPKSRDSIQVTVTVTVLGNQLLFYLNDWGCSAAG
jgi:hypothetical protein